MNKLGNRGMKVYRMTKDEEWVFIIVKVLTRLFTFLTQVNIRADARKKKQPQGQQVANSLLIDRQAERGIEGGMWKEG